MPGESTIGQLPELNAIDDDSLLLTEDSNVAYKIAGSVLKQYVGDAAMSAIADDVAAVASGASRSEAAANNADLASTAARSYSVAAAASAAEAEAASQSIGNLGVDSVQLQPGATPTVSKTVDQQTGDITLIFGLVPGPQGVKGDDGDVGPRGPKGDTGTAIGVEITGLTDGLVWFAIDNNTSSPTYGHLIATYNNVTGFNPAGLYIDFESDPDDPMSTYGHLMYDPDAVSS